MTTTTIRISIQTRELLQELAQHSGISMQAILEQALEQYRRQQILDATNIAYAKLQADPIAWADMEQERSDWDESLADGLMEE